MEKVSQLALMSYKYQFEENSKFFPVRMLNKLSMVKLARPVEKTESFCRSALIHMLRLAISTDPLLLYQ